jgi:hypothetical protein
MKNWVRMALLGLVVLMATGQKASATILTGSVTGGTAFTNGGTFIKLSVPLGNPFGPPNSVGNNTFQNNNLYGFDESQNVTVTGSPLLVDVGASPIAVGTTVASHYIFFDPGQSRSIVGTVDFDSEVLAIITSTTNLLNSDYLANTGVNYLNPTARGLEPGDSVTISGLKQIRFATTASTPGDYVRVLTKFSPAAVPVPEPSTMMAAGVGVVLLAASRRRRARAAARA